MSNYCSLGVDARIGLGFDRNRTKYRCCNKVVYGWEGLKKFVRPIANVNGGLLDSMDVIEEDKDKRDNDNNNLQQNNKSLTDSPTQPKNKDKPTVVSHVVKLVQGISVKATSLFVSKKKAAAIKKASPGPPAEGTKRLKIDPINLIILNIDSYMAGIRNMWDKSSKSNTVEGQTHKLDHKQSISDGQIEFLSFTNRIRFGVLERLFTGGGKRVAQGKK